MNDLPDATRRYAENVLEALTNLWIKRTDTDDLLHSAAQSNAANRLSEEESRIQTLVIQLDEARAELDAAQERAAVYRKLQHEHQTKLPEHHQNDQCEPAGLGEGSQSSGGEGMALDDRDKAILAARVAAFDSTEGPRVGDYVRFADGVTRRISYAGHDPRPGRATVHDLRTDRSADEYWFSSAGDQPTTHPCAGLVLVLV
jgi:hypothetical protein